MLTAKLALLTPKNSEEKGQSTTKTEGGERPLPHVAEVTGENSTSKTGEIPTRKVEISGFSGDNPEGWILQAERYFMFYRSSEEEKKEIAFYSMAGEALIWFQSEESQQPMTSWDDFRERLLLRFGSGHGGSPYTRLMNLKQSGVVAEYRRQFEGITATAQGLPQEFLEEAFLNGLKPEIAEEVKLFCSSGLSRLKEMAQ